LKPDLLDIVLQVLVFWKMPNYNREVVSPKDYKTLAGLAQRCNKIWENKVSDAMAAALLPQRFSGCTPRPLATASALHLSAGNSTSVPSLLITALPHQPRPGAAGTAMTGVSTTLISGQQTGSAIPTAHTRKTSRPAVAACTALPALLNPAKPSPAILPALDTAMYLQTAKN
jgi:hypothetical protein